MIPKEFFTHFIVFFTTISLVSPNLGASEKCSQVFFKNTLTLSGGKPIYELKTQEDFVVMDSKDSSFSFEATLNSRGQLSIAAFLVSKESGVRSSLSGRGLYEEMINHFKVDRISSIKGVWTEGNNYGQFFRNIERGLSKEDAALATWSGQQASRNGFSKIRSVDLVDNIIPGLLQVVVIFERSKPKDN